MSSLWFVAVAVLLCGSMAAAVAARLLHRDTSELADGAADMAALGDAARALGGEVEALRQRLASTAAARGDG